MGAVSRGEARKSLASMKPGQRAVIGGHPIQYLGRVTFDDEGQPFLTTLTSAGRKLYQAGDGILTEQEALVLIQHGRIEDK